MMRRRHKICEIHSQIILVVQKMTKDVKKVLEGPSGDKRFNKKVVFGDVDKILIACPPSPINLFGLPR